MTSTVAARHRENSKARIAFRVHRRLMVTAGQVLEKAARLRSVDRGILAARATRRERAAGGHRPMNSVSLAGVILKARPREEDSAAKVAVQAAPAGRRLLDRDLRRRI